MFADIVDQSGFPWTLVGSIDLPQINGTPLSGDDSGGQAPALTSSSDSAVDVLDDGTRVVWHRDTAALRANAPMILRFEVQDQNGKPATDVEPYMGMAAHAEIISSDLQVFAHIHPSGSVPMASLMMASANSADSMAGMNMSDTNLTRGASHFAGAIDALWFPQARALPDFSTVQTRRQNRNRTFRHRRELSRMEKHANPEVVIVGAGIGGSALATVLARAASR